MVPEDNGTEATSGGADVQFACRRCKGKQRGRMEGGEVESEGGWETRCDRVMESEIYAGRVS